jgi:hypothetical protein
MSKIEQGRGMWILQTITASGKGKKMRIYVPLTNSLSLPEKL